MSDTPNITKEGVTVEPGQVWRDLDKRVTARLGHERSIEIIRVDAGKAVYSCKVGDKQVEKKVSIDRMHKHATGFELLGKKIQPATA